MNRFTKDFKIKCIMAAVGLFLVLLLCGSVLIVGEHLGGIHPVVSWFFYALILAGFLWLIVSPLWSYLHMPTFPASTVVDFDTPPAYKTCMRIARGLSQSDALPAEQQAALQVACDQKSDLLPLLEEAFNGPVKKSLNEKTYRTAKGVFVACAVSQSTQLDMLIILASNIKLILQLIRQTGYRPSWANIGRLYVNIFLTALLVEALEEIDFGDFVASMQGMPSIPGLNIAAQSLLHGAGCAFFTLRIGIITQDYLYQAPGHRKPNQIRRQAFRQALPQLKQLMGDNLKVLPQEVKNLVKKAFSEKL